ncbi:DUF4328 domain-containing protein [Lentzea sp. NPDC051838]|uniref:DUF4328 domain-containing protein n=1 Tax=Lentzea sp. NPDC051838 TaxID=3154849 RepID=UPI00343D8440
MSVVRPAHAVGKFATAAIFVAAGIQVLIAVMLWSSANEASGVLVDWAALFVQVVAGVAFVVWMSQARLNSDVITSKHQHRYANMWVFVGWIIPFLNLFIPFVVMQDIWRGSDRSQPMVGLKQRPQSGLVTAWWLCYLASNALVLIAGNSAVQDYATVYTLSAVMSVAAASLAARMIKRVNAMQEEVPSHLGES